MILKLITGGCVDRCLVKEAGRVMVSARREDPVVKSGLRRRWRRRRWSLRKSGGILSIYDVISTHMNVLQILVAVNVHKQFLDSDNDNRKK